MNRLKIKEAIAYYNSKNTAKLRQLGLGEIMFPGVDQPSQILHNWDKGKRLTYIKSEHIKAICKHTGVDANFLYGISPTTFKKMNASAVSGQVDPATIKNICKTFSVDANSLFNVKPMKA